LNRNEIDLVIPSDMEYEPVVVRSAGTVAEQMGFPRARVEDVKTVVGEAFINAVEHGNRGQSRRKVTIRFYRAGRSLRIDVSDGGTGFNPEKIPQPHLMRKIHGQEPLRGWGLYLIEQLVDRLEVRSRFPFGSCLRLTLLPEQSSGDPEEADDSKD